MATIDIALSERLGRGPSEVLASPLGPVGKALTCCFSLLPLVVRCFVSVFPLWGAADTEIKVPSDENTELKGSSL